MALLFGPSINRREIRRISPGCAGKGNAMTEARITPGLEKPPYCVEAYPIGCCVCNADGTNVLSFQGKPGAKFTTPQAAKAICDEWNEVGAAP